MVTPGDIRKKQLAQEEFAERKKRNGSTKRKHPRGVIVNQPLKGNVELYKLKNQLRKEQGK